MNYRFTEVTQAVDTQIDSLRVGINEDIQRIISRMGSLARDIADLQLQRGDLTGLNDASMNSKKIIELEKEILEVWKGST